MIYYENVEYLPKAAAEFDFPTKWFGRTGSNSLYQKLFLDHI